MATQPRTDPGREVGYRTWEWISVTLCARAPRPGSDDWQMARALNDPEQSDALLQQGIENAITLLAPERPTE